MKTLIYITMLLASINGAEIAGVSLTKVALIPLEFALLSQVGVSGLSKVRIGVKERQSSLK